MDHWTETIQALEERAVELETFAQKAREAAQTLREIKPRWEVAKKAGPQTAPPKPGIQARPEKRKGRSGLRRAKPGRFKGVTEMVSKRDHSIKYRASAWDGQRKKNLNLGSYNSPLEAALVVAKQLGDAEEVQRLSDMLEQQQNNPDKPPTRKAQKAKDNDDDRPAQPGYVGNVWVCDKCGHQHLQIKCPERCEACGHGLLSKFD